MKIVVFIKQVPDNTKLKLDQISEAGVPQSGVDMMINPFDEYALETALLLKEVVGGDSTVTVISLGQESVKDIVKKAIAAGADDAFILSDNAFQNGDTTATAYALAEGVKSLVPDAQLLIFGQQALDDAAGQTGPKVAELLGYPSITMGKNAELIDATHLKITRETERGLEIYQVNLPTVLCMMKCDYELRTANIKGVMKANKTQIPVKTAGELNLAVDKVGLKGSATETFKIRQRPAKTGGKKIEPSDAKAAAQELIQYLRETKVI
jgi:electron transfer flavoprotein beta subunit